MILVDTSVWVQHLARTPSAMLASLLDDGRVAGHPFVVGELACGHMRQRQEILGRLALLPSLEVAGHDDALALLERRRLQGGGLSWIDVHLLASALIGHVSLWTLDKPLAAAARSLGIHAAPR